MNRVDWERVEPGRFVAHVRGSCLQVLRSPDRGPDRGFISVVDKRVLPTPSKSWQAAKSKAIAAVEKRSRTRAVEPFSWERGMIERAAKELGLPNPYAEPEPEPEPVQVEALEPEPEPVGDPLGFHPFEDLEPVEPTALDRRPPELEPPADVQELRVELSATILTSDVSATIEAVRAAAGLLRELGVVVCTIDLPPRISV